MTEATRSSITPILIFCSTQHDQKESVVSEMKQRYGNIPNEQLTWINEEFGTVTIEMVRTLIQDMSFASFQGKTRHVVILSIDHATKEAQNALLKLLEEPPAQTQLWLSATQPSRLLETIKSRCEEMYLTSTDSVSIPEEVTVLATQFGTLSYRELSDAAGNYSDREEAKNLIQHLVHYFHRQSSKKPNPTINQSLHVLLETLKLVDANVNVRLALEQCFFSLKKILA